MLRFIYPFSLLHTASLLFSLSPTVLCLFLPLYYMWNILSTNQSQLSCSQHNCSLKTHTHTHEWVSEQRGTCPSLPLLPPLISQISAYSSMCDHKLPNIQISALNAQCVNQTWNFSATLWSLDIWDQRVSTEQNLCVVPADVSGRLTSAIRDIGLCWNSYWYSVYIKQNGLGSCFCHAIKRWMNMNIFFTGRSLRKRKSSDH